MSGSILIAFATHPCLLVFVWEISFQGLLGGAGICPSTVWLSRGIDPMDPRAHPNFRDALVPLGPISPGAWATCALARASVALEPRTICMYIYIYIYICMYTFSFMYRQKKTYIYIYMILYAVHVHVPRTITIMDFMPPCRF